ncbi:MAG: CocE/NonD family hydrolase [Verrucomicrobia bacterium]|nr:CocE/NonD family hydrolase [Verrucomicrobiota bacterium]
MVSFMLDARKRILLGSGVLFLLLSLTMVLNSFGGAFTKYNTRIPVPARATGTDTGDTESATTNTIRLDASVYIPDGAVAPTPVIIVIHGYAGAKNDERVVMLAEEFASAGYVVLAPTARGFGNSDGNVAVAGPNEINDLKTLILAMQTGTIGDSPAITVPVTAASKFGVGGASYGGGHSFEIMRTHVPGLAAVAPIVGWTDLYQALCPKDVPKLAYAVGFFASGYDPAHPNYADQMFDWIKNILGGQPEKVHVGDSQTSIDWRSVIFDPAELQVPAFVIQGWRDHLFPAEQATALFETNTNIPFFKLYLGGLGHPPASSDLGSSEGLYMRAQLRRWFDQWLKGIDTGILTEPRVTVAPEKSTDWSEAALVFADAFPLPGTITNIYYLNGILLSTTGSSGTPQKLSPTAGGSTLISFIRNAFGGDAAALMTTIIAVNEIINASGDIFSPNIVTKSDDSANARNYTSQPLANDLNVVGLPTFQLFVSAAKTNACYFVQLLEKLPDGRLKLVTRGAFKDHTAAFQNPHSIEFSPFAINHVFKAGSRIRLRITSRDYPFFLPNLNQPKVKIYRDANHPSRFTLPVAP